METLVSIPSPAVQNPKNDIVLPVEKGTDPITNKNSKDRN